MAEDMMTEPSKPSEELISPREANYREAEDPNQVCQRCKNFILPSSCSVVQGTIDPTFTCDLFMGKEAEPQGADMMSMLFGGPGGQSVPGA